MKILLLGFGKIAYMPYMHLYLDCLKDVDFELIYWDRDGKLDAELPTKIKKAYKFEKHLEEQLPFLRKLKYFYGYRRFALNIFKHNRYDKVIVLHTTPGLTLLDYLSRKYKGKYLLDFRDVSYEYIPIYRKIVSRLAENSHMTLVSSDAFRKFLPKNLPIYTVHNYLSNSLNYRGVRTKQPRQREVLRLSYWGLVRQVGTNKKIMDALGNDPRFEIHYYGRMQQDGRDMQQYADAKRYQNVYFHGSYMPEDRYEFAANTDLIHNVYDVDNTTGNAMGNKYYDGIIFKIPQICMSKSYMGEMVEKNQLGVSIDFLEENVADKIWEYYHSIQWGEFEKTCDAILDEVMQEQNFTKEKIIQWSKED